MLSNEGLNDILEDAQSDLGDEGYLQDDDLGEEIDLNANVDENIRETSTRPQTNKSIDSKLRGSSKAVRLKPSQPRLYDFSATNLKRDLAIERIIESRKATIIENEYTVLAQTTSQGRRQSPHARMNSVKLQRITNPTEAEAEAEANTNDAKDRTTSRQSKNTLSTPAVQLDNDKWDDGLNTDFDRESVASIDKSSLQIYEETCKRLNICPCSMVIRSLHTTKINLENYGLGPKGSAALAVALVRNTYVTTLNLSGNDIGNNGMSHIYQILTENSYIEEYNLSYNNLGAKGIRKLAKASAANVSLRTLSIAGNGLTANDINMFLSKIEASDRLLTDLNLSHNILGEDGGKYVAKWLRDNNILLNLDISWCSIRLSGTHALAEAIGDNNKLLSLDLSNNSFGNDSLDKLTSSLSRNMILTFLNLSENQIVSRYTTQIKEDPSILLVGSESSVYKLFAAVATSQALKKFQIGKNHLDARCAMIMLESLGKVENITLEELDLTGLTLTLKQMADIHGFFANHPKFTCYAGPVRQTVEQFANNLVNTIHKYCHERQMNVTKLFIEDEEMITISTTITYDEFRDGLRKAKIPFPAAQMENIMKYLGGEYEDGAIPLSSLEVDSRKMMF
ncbi:unnamed protein product [Rotaria magnacalcarata]|uniref:Uncharacterized protein n=1 Tax=Rotaria magnacalcarata TaxID=392030 RepID=A0A816G3H9_9BILA|nr:unnamed protein product [Rotaria magnacalcarata]CAF1669192.1 unnamed protein product [Rotaria magnacalcarata]CAF2042483.1 unnamed protein product [Rotaria magnacalcarata]CAF3745941.1 unnamed protein product [Rotaria magnacalcarata]CAF4124420.1 unnamed protein product [Rotaria magnacalcarata]